MGRRLPAAAGAFYPSTRDEVVSQLEWCFNHPLGPRGSVSENYFGEEIHAFICPHAGYIYSGPIAAHSYDLLRNLGPKCTIIVLGPNHFGLGSDVSIYPVGEWVTPLGSVSIDSKLAVLLSELSDIFSLDEVSHVSEHSIEVQLPFLQHVLESPRIVPICILDQTRQTCLEVGKAVAELMKSNKCILIASSDFTHYEPHEVVMKKDSLAIDAIRKMSLDQLYEAVEERGVSMCGYGAVASVLQASKLCGGVNVRILKQATSGDTSEQKGSVVGYVSAVITG